MYQCREDKTRFPGFLCPDYAGFLGMTENHFFDALASVLNDPNVDCRYVLRVISRKKNIETQIMILCLAIFFFYLTLFCRFLKVMDRVPEIEFSGNYPHFFSATHCRCV